MVELEISAITDEFSLEFDEVCEHLQGMDVSHVELRNVWLGNILVVDDQTIGDAKDVLDDCGLKVSAIAGPLMKCLPPSLHPEPKEPMNYSENWKYNFSLFERALELAETFDTRYMRCFGFHGKFDVPPVDQWDEYPVYKEWRDVLSGFTAKAAEKGKMLICENEGGLVKVLDQMERVGKNNCGPGFGMLYDTANVANKDGPEGVLSEEWLPRFAPCIQYVHAKGCKKNIFGSGYSTSLVNETGDICRWPRLVEYFKTMAPGDFIAPPPEPLFLSIETHCGKKDKWNKSTTSLRNLIELVRGRAHAVGKE